MITKFKKTLLTKEQSDAYNNLKDTFTDRLREVFQDNKFTKTDIKYSKSYFLDLETRYKEIFKTKWSFFDYDERLSNLIAQTGVSTDNIKMENGTYWFI